MKLGLTTGTQYYEQNNPDCGCGSAHGRLLQKGRYDPFFTRRSRCFRKSSANASVEQTRGKDARSRTTRHECPSRFS